jgi:hypothetical protein
VLAGLSSAAEGAGSRRKRGEADETGLRAALAPVKETRSSAVIPAADGLSAWFMESSDWRRPLKISAKSNEINPTEASTTAPLNMTRMIHSIAVPSWLPNLGVF